MHLVYKTNFTEYNLVSLYKKFFLFFFFYNKRWFERRTRSFRALQK